jgi:galactokinase
VSKAARVHDAFVQEFGAVPRMCWAPGRVNLLGDHIDYCGGVVLPMPIQFGTAVAAGPRRDHRVRAVSLDASTRLDLPAARDAALPRGHWGRFVLGALAVLEESGCELAGADVLVGGDIPGSGLSSSASLAVALLTALGACARRPLQGLSLALAAQRIEHRYVDVECGLMDQAVIVFGERDRALRFDCFDHRHRSVELPEGLAVVVFDTGRARQLAHSAYNERLAETAAAASSLGIAREQLARLEPGRRQALLERLRDPVLLRRARHVVGEAERVDAACVALAAADLTEFGRLLRSSHVSLRDDYAVSCAELDALTGTLNDTAGCYGARMTGAGFGGCVVAAVDPKRIADVTAAAERDYGRQFGAVPQWFVARSVGGVRRIDD